MIKAIIFDMDGVMVDSEPFWRQAEIEVFAKVNVMLTEEDCLKTLGYRIDEVAEYWYNISPWTGVSTTEVAGMIVDRMVELVSTGGQPMKGLLKCIELLKTTNLPLAVASSSPSRLIEATVNRLDIKKNFDVLCSAETEEYGKPHPGVFLSAAKQLGISPNECLVIEDSPSGVIAALAAKMKVIAVPEKQNRQRPEFLSADYVLESLEEFSPEHYS